MIIGGEHYFSPGHLLKKSKGYVDSLIKEFQKEYYVNFTFGGYFSILAIIDEIMSNFDKDSYILLPSYMCPSILIPFKTRGIKYKFYKVDEDLFVDTEYLSSIIDDKVKVVFFIDYFGASQLKRLLPIIESLNSKNIIIIQDVVQCLEIKKEFLYGDYIFNSFRKFFPFEGSILLSKENMNINFSKNKNRYIKPKRIGQLLRYFHINFRLFSSKYFLKLFSKANKIYHLNEIFRMPHFNIKQLNKYDINKLSNNQNHYFRLLFQEYGNLTPELLKEGNLIPLGFVIKLNQRDEVRKKMFEQNIYPPIHWLLSKEVENILFEKSVHLSSKILTIPLHGLTDKKYKYLTNELNKIINNESIS